MSENLKPILQRLDGKMNLLRQRLTSLQAQEAQLKELVAGLRQECRKQQLQAGELAQQVENLQVVTTLAPDREKAALTRTMLAELVREIDRCIADIS